MSQKPKFFMMVGLPASGKSSFAEIIAKEHNAEIFSSDAIRQELLKIINYQDNNELVFKTLHERVKKCLAEGRNCIYDATNINWKRRRAFLNEIKKYNCEKHAVVCATPVKECIKRNKLRKWQYANNLSVSALFPSSQVIYKMYSNFTIPYWYEGWDDIHVFYMTDNLKKQTITDFVENTWTYDQRNSHHVFSLGKHCLHTQIWASRLYREQWDGYAPQFHETPLFYASAIHDIGKLTTRTFTNARGEDTEEAHYYNHQNAGAYESLFYDFGDIRPIDVAVLVQWHMQPYFNKEEKARLKYENLWKPELTKLIYILHEADMKAH